MIWWALDAVLFVSGLFALHVLGLPPPYSVGAMALLWFLASILFRLVGVAGLFLLPWGSIG